MNRSSELQSPRAESEGEGPREWVAGADGFRDGWFVVLWRRGTGVLRRRIVDGVGALVQLPERPAVLGIDMIVGLPDRAEQGGRQCDRLARQLLGQPRGRSVFSPPAYDALGADTQAEASARNRATHPDGRGVSIQTFHLFPKMREVAAHVTPDRQSWIREVHPELAFYAMNDDAPVVARKHDADGRRQRTRLLVDNGFPDVDDVVERLAGGSLTADDILDAHAVCWSAQRIRDGRAQRLPPLDVEAPQNERGRTMTIWR